MRWIIARETDATLLYVNGRFERTLDPGRHFLVSLPWLRREVVRVDLRRTPLNLSGQEMLSSDGVTVKMNVVAVYRVADARLARHETFDYGTALYLALQLILREEVQSRTLEAILGDRGAVGDALLERGRAPAAEIGLELVSTGVKDVMLPGDVKKMLSRELEAVREGRAALVAAREETAATRARANTARMLQENPVLLRLRELEALTAGETERTVVYAMPTEVLSGIVRRGGDPV
jgi:regulator of protease activity HflC (stomatin/prohibitin superfamily)